MAMGLGGTGIIPCRRKTWCRMPDVVPQVTGTQRQGARADVHVSRRSRVALGYEQQAPNREPDALQWFHGRAQKAHSRRYRKVTYENLRDRCVHFILKTSRRGDTLSAHSDLSD